MKPPPLTILFAGERTSAKLIDGTEVPVFIRSLPERYLLGHFLANMEFGHATIQLCTYIEDFAGEALSGDFPDIPAPTGYRPVPTNWADNLSDESMIALYELAKKINFKRAAKLAEGQIAAKKQIAPLNQMVMKQVMPLVEHALDGLLKKFSSSTPSTLPSPAATVKPV